MKKTIIFLAILILIGAESPTLAVLGAPTTPEDSGTCAKYTSDRESCLECVDHFHLF